MTATIPDLMATVERELHAPGRSVLTGCPRTWAWLCELIDQIERYTPEGPAQRAADEPDAWPAHAAYHTAIVSASGNLPVKRLVEILAEWHPFEMPLEADHGQRLDAYLRAQLHDLGMRVLARLYGDNTPN